MRVPVLEGAEAELSVIPDNPLSPTITRDKYYIEIPPPPAMNGLLRLLSKEIDLFSN